MSDTKFTYNGIDLRTSTVFDLTDDKDFLSRFLSLELGIKNKEDFISMGENTPQSRAFSMMEYAEEKKLKTLIEKLNSIYSDEINLFFNE
ncbi:hypothetical protein ACNQF7_03825 [Flavobacterium sp. RSP29]|uniref:hypothetical protein n=1 Tax=Flavobacterium sp. RSP29 TaxID=3401731 RepID=UPI003AB0C27F